MHGTRDVQRLAAGSSSAQPGLGTSASAGSPSVGTGAPQEGDDAAGAANANDAVRSARTEAPRLPIVIADALPSRSGALRNLPESFFSPAGRRGKRGHAYHGAPRIVVDVPRASGAIAADALQRVARDLGYWPFRRCYEEALRRTPTVHGTVFLRMTVAADGSVARIATAAADADLRTGEGQRAAEPAQDPVLSEPAVSGCVARETTGIAFEGGDAESEALLAVVLTPGDTPLPSAPATAGAGSLRDALRALWPAVGRCYEVGLERRPWLGGPMELRFEFEDDFSLDVAEAGTRFADGAVTDCVKDVYRSAHLPRGADSVFFYDLDFERNVDATPTEREPQ
jgi:hypothetical protein